VHRQATRCQLASAGAAASHHMAHQSACCSGDVQGASTWRWPLVPGAAAGQAGSGEAASPAAAESNQSARWVRPLYTWWLRAVHRRHIRAVALRCGTYQFLPEARPHRARRALAAAAAPQHAQASQAAAAHAAGAAAAKCTQPGSSSSSCCCCCCSFACPAQHYRYCTIQYSCTLYSTVYSCTRFNSSAATAAGLQCIQL
jgi:hypothetical protein